MLALMDVRGIIMMLENSFCVSIYRQFRWEINVKREEGRGVLTRHKCRLRLH